MGGYEHLALVGTTAVVALVGSRMIYVANCGDSRAVLCRSGGALALTDDHKAAREDETVSAAAWLAGGAGESACLHHLPGFMWGLPRGGNNQPANPAPLPALLVLLALLQARVEAAGGQILFWNGVRVMGLLAVSRAIGDHSLRPYVIAEPEVRGAGWSAARVEGLAGKQRLHAWFSKLVGCSQAPPF